MSNGRAAISAGGLKVLGGDVKLKNMVVSRNEAPSGGAFEVAMQKVSGAIPTRLFVQARVYAEEDVMSASFAAGCYETEAGVLF